MIIDSHMQRLNLDELRTARERMDAMIRAREAEQRRGVWVVEGYLLPLHRFPEDAYVQAAEALLEEARRLARTEAKPHRRTLSLTYKLVPASECGDLPA